MKIPTLNAWIDSPDKQADYLLSCFYTSEQLQSTVSFSRIQSMPYLVQRYGKSPLDLQSKAREELQKLLENVFQVRSLDVKVNESSTVGELNIKFHCVIQIDGREESVGHLVRYVDGRLREIQKSI